MTRRNILLALVLSLAVATTSAWGQQPSGIPIVGFVATASIGPDDPLVEAFRAGLRELGYVDGQNIRIEFRSAQGQADRLPLLARELVQLKVNAIVVGTESAVRAAKQATSTTPIVAISFDYDLVASGLIASYNRPDANVTGIYTRQPELIGKRLELLKEALPGLSRVAVFWDAFGERQLEEVKRAAHSLHIQIEPVKLAAPYYYKAAFKSAKRKRAGAALLLTSGTFYADRSRIAQQALEDHLPIMSHLDQLTRAGGLISYGPDARDTYRRIAYFIDRLLKGAKPGDLPVEQPTKFELVVNLKTAKALGMKIPDSILLQADEVIK
jgi:putative ABC transport system substrate-binding protein